MLPDLSQLSEKEIRALAAGDSRPDGYLEACRADPRAGVRRLAETLVRREAAAQRERERLSKLLAFEQQLSQRGSVSIGGVDEVGRGPLAGPVVAACVILPTEDLIAGVNDSKQLSAARREALDALIRRRALGIGIARVEAADIDRINIFQASKLAMKMAVEACAPARPDSLLIDAMRLSEVGLPQLSVVHGDERSYLIAAASIVAKVYRDGLMRELDSRYPHYRFASNKGYGTREHLEALERFGPSDIHRRSFAPVIDYALPSCGLFLQQIGRATSLDALRQAGLRIRERGSHLTPGELAELREAYRARLSALGNGIDSIIGP